VGGDRVDAVRQSSLALEEISIKTCWHIGVMGKIAPAWCRKQRTRKKAFVDMAQNGRALPYST
jgi:hypothetical protein